MAFAAQHDAAIARKIALGQRAALGMAVGSDAANAKAAKFTERLQKSGGFDHRQLENGPHRIPHRTAHVRGTAGFSRDKSMDAESDAVAHDDAKIFRVVQ